MSDYKSINIIKLISKIIKYMIMIIVIFFYYENISLSQNNAINEIDSLDFKLKDQHTRIIDNKRKILHKIEVLKKKWPLIFVPSEGDWLQEISTTMPYIAWNNNPFGWDSVWPGFSSISGSTDNSLYEKVTQYIQKNPESIKNLKINKKIDQLIIVNRINSKMTKPFKNKTSDKKKRQITKPKPVKSGSSDDNDMPITKPLPVKTSPSDNNDMPITKPLPIKTSPSDDNDMPITKPLPIKTLPSDDNDMPITKPLPIKTSPSDDNDMPITKPLPIKTSPSDNNDMPITKHLPNKTSPSSENDKPIKETVNLKNLNLKENEYQKINKSIDQIVPSKTVDNKINKTRTYPPDFEKDDLIEPFTKQEKMNILTDNSIANERINAADNTSSYQQKKKHKVRKEIIRPYAKIPFCKKLLEEMFIEGVIGKNEFNKRKEICEKKNHFFSSYKLGKYYPTEIKGGDREVELMSAILKKRREDKGSMDEKGLIIEIRGEADYIPFEKPKKLPRKFEFEQLTKCTISQNGYTIESLPIEKKNGEYFFHEPELPYIRAYCLKEYLEKNHFIVKNGNAIICLTGKVNTEKKGDVEGKGIPDHRAVSVYLHKIVKEE